YVENKGKLKGVPIAMKAGAKAVAPAPEHVLDSSYQPLSRPIFIYVRKDAADKNPAVRQFVEFYLTEGPALAGQVGFVPLPDDAAQVALRHFRENRVGSVFGGVPEVGITIQELLEREAKL
ncbi:MAG: protein sphX, partial [Steroidobacteraceae bacterium]